MAIAVIIVLVGCCSALREVRAEGALRQDSRDGVWDVIKFALILCVSFTITLQGEIGVGYISSDQHGMPDL